MLFVYLFAYLQLNDAVSSKENVTPIDFAIENSTLERIWNKAFVE